MFRIVTVIVAGLALSCGIAGAQPTTAPNKTEAAAYARLSERLTAMLDHLQPGVESVCRDEDQRAKLRAIFSGHREALRKLPDGVESGSISPERARETASAVANVLAEVVKVLDKDQLQALFKKMDQLPRDADDPTSSVAVLCAWMRNTLDQLHLSEKQNEAADAVIADFQAKAQRSIEALASSELTTEAYTKRAAVEGADFAQQLADMLTPEQAMELQKFFESPADKNEATTAPTTVPH